MLMSFGQVEVCPELHLSGSDLRATLSALPQLSLSSLLCQSQHKASERVSLKYFVLLGKYLNRVDRVMTQVDKISEDIEHIPVATFIFRDSESVMVNYTSDRRLSIRIKFDL